MDHHSVFIGRRMGVVALIGTALGFGPIKGQISWHPTGVNVDSQGATSVFISFGSLDGYTPVEAIWCGEIEPAAPDIGDRCVPGTVFGALPVRFNLARLSGRDGLTDIMSIPPSVARRAYQAAQNGSESQFFYVRRFIDATGQGRPDQFVTVTCRLTGGGARTPLSLTDIRIAFSSEDPVFSLSSRRRASVHCGEDHLHRYRSVEGSVGAGAARGRAARAPETY